jgi:histidinol-phosphatase
MTSKFLEVALTAARKADEITLRYFHTGARISYKEDQSPVTEADKETEQVIRQIIHQAFPSHGIIGEEYGIEGSGDYRWIIDPIDGTLNFMRGIPFYGTLIALAHKDEIILGVSSMPAMREFMYAEQGSGTFFNEVPMHVSRRPIEDSYLSFGSVTKLEAEVSPGTLAALSEKTRYHNGFGAPWNYHMVSQGKLEAMVQARISIWDIAPFITIIQEAGGRITDFAGNPITMDSGKISVVASNGLVHDSLLEVVQK